MAKLMVLQHVSYELLGTMNPLLKKQGIRIKYVNFGRHPHLQPDVSGYDGLIILGGPMNVDQVDLHPHLKKEIHVIQTAMSKGIPTLGICLGAQLIAKAAGASVRKNHCKEIGWYDVRPTQAAHQDPLLKFFQKSEKIFQWHGDTFELPENAVLLAESDSCLNQAFRINDTIYGFQFHLEVDAAMIERWLTVPVHQQELTELKGQIDPDIIRQETPTYIHRTKELSHQVFIEFGKMIGNVRPPVRLQSR